MDAAKKHRIEQWVEQNVYSFFDRQIQQQTYPTAGEAAQIAPLLQMYLAIKLDETSNTIDSIWQLLIDGEAGIYIKTVHDGIDVNISDKSKGA